MARLFVPLVLGRTTLSVWHNDALHTALLQTLKLGVITTLITVPLGGCSPSASTAGAAGCPKGANFLMLLSFVLPEVLLAVALLFVLTTVALPVDLGTTAQVIGLITFQVSYPAVLVRARLRPSAPNTKKRQWISALPRLARFVGSSCRC